MVNGQPVPGNEWDRLDGQWPAEQPTVSVVVIHFDQQRELDRTLAALAVQDYPASLLEIVVVDDGSPSAPTVPNGVRLVRQADHGFRAAEARNRGARESTGDVLCFLDADTAPEPQYVREITRLPALAPDIVTVGRRRHADFTRSDAPGVDGATDLELPAPEWLDEAYRHSDNLLVSDNRSYRFVISAVVACSRALFEEIGGFDETFRDYGGEDWEWAHRAWLAGGLLAHVPNAVAWHDGPDWGSRELDDPGKRAAKNNEMLVLSRAIPIMGSRGRAVRGPIADVVAVLESASSAAAAFICVDSLLERLPHTSCVVPHEYAAVFASDDRVIDASTARAREAIGRARVVITLDSAIRVEDPVGDAPEAGADLPSAVERVGAGREGAVVFTTDGASVRVQANRAAARAARWGRDDLFATTTVDAPWLSPLETEPRLGPYLGGWG
ncbi:MAG: glycosyltransferase [Glaciihabitans sp.]